MRLTSHVLLSLSHVDIVKTVCVRDLLYLVPISAYTADCAYVWADCYVNIFSWRPHAHMLLRKTPAGVVGTVSKMLQPLYEVLRVPWSARLLRQKFLHYSAYIRLCAILCENRRCHKQCHVQSLGVHRRTRASWSWDRQGRHHPRLMMSSLWSTPSALSVSGTAECSCRHTQTHTHLSVTVTFCICDLGLLFC